eukprot:TRINITY_DN502_c0_g5_i2.p1 TRINITY_DN502_c0_g5~~TRINITY_DN502_c0_g5_i2.p1  ORF type:complete len:319 (+),score=59.86 TRINITY_DN502_c0_g5_i2:144-1100(+)
MIRSQPGAWSAVLCIVWLPAYVVAQCALSRNLSDPTNLCLASTSNTSVIFRKKGGASFHLTNNAPHDRFEISSEIQGQGNMTKLLAIDALTGNTAVRGHLIVGEVTGNRTFRVQSYQGETTLAVKSRSKDATARKAELSVVADGKTASGDASVSVSAEHGRSDVDFVSSGTNSTGGATMLVATRFGQADMRLLSQGTNGTVLSVLSTNVGSGAHSRLDVWANPTTGATSGNAEVFVYSRSQNAVAQVKTSGAAGRAGMKVLSEGTNGTVLTVLSTNVGTSAHSILDISANPALGSSSGDAEFNAVSYTHLTLPTKRIV